MSGEWLVWMWHHGGLDVSEHDSLRSAVGVAEAIQDMGDGSLRCIEGPNGVVSKDDYDAEARAMRQREREAEAASPTPKFTHWIKLVSPDGKDYARWDWYRSLTDAEAEVARLRPRFGDRVSLEVAR